LQNVIGVVDSIDFGFGIADFGFNMKKIRISFSIRNLKSNIAEPNTPVLQCRQRAKIIPSFNGDLSSTQGGYV
jgi:hypothetical protein